MAQTPERTTDNVEARRPERPAVVDSPTIDRGAPDSIRAMTAANERGTSTAMRQFDAGNAFQISDGGRRLPGPKDVGITIGGGEGPEEKPRTTNYKVEKGETLWKLSERHQTDNGTKPTPQQIMEGVGQILEANPRLNPEARLLPGQQIKMPEGLNTGIRQHGTEHPGKPAALVIDEFNGGATMKGVADTSHGNFIATTFNALGFNTFKGSVGQGPEIGQDKGRSDFSGAMERAANFIQANPEKFPPGSFVNTSFGNQADRQHPNGTGDPTYADLTKVLHMPITPESIGGQRDEILKRLERVAGGRNAETDQPDKTITPEWRKMADAAIRTNAQIDRIQKLGVEVIHSAGNDGPNRVDINFLRSTQLRADGPDGKPLGFSAIGSHTQTGAGVYQFHLLNKNEVGTVVNGTLVRFPVDKSHPFDHHDHVVNYPAFSDPKHKVEPFPRLDRHNAPKFDPEAQKRGYEQRVYNALGPVVDMSPGTSFSPFEYVVRTRHLDRPPTP